MINFNQHNFFRTQLYLILGIIHLFSNHSSYARDIDSNVALENCQQLLTGHPPSLKMTEGEHWLAAGLNYKSLEKYKLINEKQCRKTALDFVMCISAINALSNEAKETYLLLPRVLRNKYKSKINSVVEEFGDLLLVELKSELDFERGDNVEKIFLAHKELEREYQQAVGELFRSTTFKLKNMLQAVVSRVQDKTKEGLQVATAFNTAFYFEDPHAYLVPASLFEENESKAGVDRLVGVGAVIKNIAGHYSVAKVVEGGPAAVAGLHTGDVILAVNGQSAEKMVVQELLHLISGKEGTVVQFTLKRRGKTFNINIVRKGLELQNVASELIADVGGGTVGYVSLSSFTYSNACEEVRAAIGRLISQGAQKLVLDLRDNKGGLLSQGTCVAGLFIGKKIVAKKKSLENGRFSPIYSEQDMITDLPLVVLVNGESASASELVSGALRDHHRAWIMGVKTFGKATIQYSLPYDDEMKIMFYKTYEMFYQPSGSSNQIVGIAPNFTVFQNPYLEKEEFVAREIDNYPNAFPGSRKKWQEDRAAEIRKLSNCMGEHGKAVTKWNQLNENGQNADFQKLSALDLLNCL